ncbi:MAG: DEAD/DEAH box helicase [Phycisphaeraceae bacterium]
MASQTPQTLPSSPPAIVPSGRWRRLATPTDNPTRLKGLDAMWNRAAGRLGALWPVRRQLLRQAQRIEQRTKSAAGLDDGQLQEELATLRERFRLGRETPADLDRALAMVCETASRQLDMRPYRVQIAAALALHRGMIAEMATGEGKTLAAGLAAVLAGWRGRGCHVLTVNDYLARRDADWLMPLYDFCGLRVAAIEQSMPPQARRNAYAADITYATHKEVAGDFLRDQLVMGGQHGLPEVLLHRLTGNGSQGPDRLVLRELACAIVDEADSILIDEAVTPLIIAGESANAQQEQAYQQAAEVAADLQSGRDYAVNPRYQEVRLTHTGQQRIQELCEQLGGIWTGARRRDELVTQALTARELYLPGKQYLVQDGKIVIVDEFTGRVMPDRTWRHGLHQALEAKEGLTLQSAKETLARISFQRFFQLYEQLAGMTGTAAEARSELWQIHHRRIVRIPTHRPCIRRHLPQRTYSTDYARWQAVAEHVRPLHEAGRPILIGSRSVAASERLSEMLTKAGLPHRMLSAVHHEQEAAVIAEAGRRGRITVATNMAGRGTDIKLGPGVAELGGLHVIATERHESGRVDRQLFGRAARQGDPGSAVAMVSLEDELLRRHAPRLARLLMPRRSDDRPLGFGRRLLAKWVFHRAQQRAQRLSLQQRKAVLDADDWLNEFLGFAGREF